MNNAGMKKDVCTNGQCQNTMKDYICVCNAGFRSDVTKKLCNGKNQINYRLFSIGFVSALSVLCLDRQTRRLVIERLTDTRTDLRTDRQTHRKRNGQSRPETDRQTDRQTDR